MSQSITFPKHHFCTSCHQRANVEHISLWGMLWIQNIKTPFQGHPSTLFLVSKPCIDSHHLTRCLCPQVFTLSLQGSGNNAVVRVTLVFGWLWWRSVAFRVRAVILFTTCASYITAPQKQKLSTLPFSSLCLLCLLGFCLITGSLCMCCLVRKPLGLWSWYSLPPCACWYFLLNLLFHF